MSYTFNFNPDSHSDVDQLGFAPYITTLSSMICDRNFKTPFCIGVYGEWGSGKTSFMRILSNKLKVDGKNPRIIPVWFNPWRYEKEEHLIIPFFKIVEQELDNYLKENKGIADEVVKNIIAAKEKIGDTAASLAFGMTFNLGIIKFDTSKAAAREEQLKKRREDESSSETKKYSSLYFNTIKELTDVIKEDSFRIAIFIDDLDRCLPENAIRLMEAIKLFLDIEGYIFVIGVDKAVVEKGIAYHYRHLDFNHDETGSGKKEKTTTIKSRDYLDKMIQFPLELPPIEPAKKIGYIKSLLGKEDDENLEYKEHAKIIESGIGSNPRKLKRYINLLAFIARHADTIKTSIENDPEVDKKHKKLIKENFIPVLYIKWSIILFAFPEVYSDIKGNPDRLLELQQLAISNDGVTEESGQLAISERLKSVLSVGNQFAPDRWLLNTFIYLTMATKVSEALEKEEKGYSLNLKPGDMVRIPSGSFLYGDNKIKKEIDYDYYMGAFPVTNAEYEEFIKAVPECKPPNDWGKEKRTFPEGKGNHPVTTVNWHDAKAYCEWKSNIDPEKYTYRLPTEEEWEKAARGTDGREYPWGNEFDKEKCNSQESGNNGSTDVTRHPQGKSPYGCHDMAGNVWEWCADKWHKSGDHRVLRGGCWRNDAGGVRSAYRYGNNPGFRDGDVGFRLSRGQEKQEQQAGA